MEAKVAKFTGTQEMDQALDRMVASVNENFSGGRISKHDMLSWAVLYFEKESFRDSIEKVRQDHFDQLAYLESILKQAKKARRNGEPRPDIAALLAPMSTLPEGASRKRRRAQIADTQAQIQVEK